MKGQRNTNAGQKSVGSVASSSKSNVISVSFNLKEKKKRDRSEEEEESIENGFFQTEC